MSIPTARASYQPTANIKAGVRNPFACAAYRIALREIAAEADKACCATTQAAYLLRIQNVRRLLKSLG